jgi:hypothetical protein
VSGSLPDCLGDGVSPSDDDKNLHHILSQAETDALEYVVEKGRIASNIDYGVLRSLLIRLRPEWERLHSDGAGYAGGISADAETKSDRSKPIKEGVFDRSKPIAGGGK